MSRPPPHGQGLAGTPFLTTFSTTSTGEFQLMQAAARILENIGFSAVTPGSLTTLSSMMKLYFEHLCLESRAAADFAGHTEVNLKDAAMALAQSDTNAAELQNYIRQVDSFGSASQVSFFPVSDPLHIPSEVPEKEGPTSESEQDKEAVMPSQVDGAPLQPHATGVKVEAPSSSATRPQTIGKTKAFPTFFGAKAPELGVTIEPPDLAPKQEWPPTTPSTTLSYDETTASLLPTSSTTAGSAEILSRRGEHEVGPCSSAMPRLAVVLQLDAELRAKAEAMEESVARQRSPPRIIVKLKKLRVSSPEEKNPSLISTSLPAVASPEVGLKNEEGEQPATSGQGGEEEMVKMPVQAMGKENGAASELREGNKTPVATLPKLVLHLPSATVAQVTEGGGARSHRKKKMKRKARERLRNKAAAANLDQMAAESQERSETPRSLTRMDISWSRPELSSREDVTDPAEGLEPQAPIPKLKIKLNIASHTTMALAQTLQTSFEPQQPASESSLAAEPTLAPFPKRSKTMAQPVRVRQTSAKATSYLPREESPVPKLQIKGTVSKGDRVSKVDAPNSPSAPNAGKQKKAASTNQHKHKMPKIKLAPTKKKPAIAVGQAKTSASSTKGAAFEVKKSSLARAGSRSSKTGKNDGICICPGCSVAYEEEEGSNWICCDGCNRWFHWHCVGILIEPPEGKKWYCSGCRKPR